MPGPIFFTQNRIGRNGREFRILKFRTMTLEPKYNESTFEPGNLTRITQLGRFLRRTKIDEIPQLINVLKGDMSIVGPRPEIKRWTEVYPDKWALVLTVQPGMTDNASIEFRNEEKILAQSEYPEETYLNTILPHKLDLYIDYVKKHNFWGDLIIILRTIETIILE